MMTVIPDRLLSDAQLDRAAASVDEELGQAYGELSSEAVRVLNAQRDTISQLNRLVVELRAQLAARNEISQEAAQ